MSKGKKTMAPKSISGASTKIGTLRGIDTILKRKGKVSTGLNPELRSSVHRSKKDYDRKREREKVRTLIKEL